MRLPQEIVDSLHSIDFRQTRDLPYDEKEIIMAAEKKKLLGIVDWMRQQKEAAEDWIDLFFDYTDRLSGDISVERGEYYWNFFLEVNTLLRRIIDTQMSKESDKGTVITKFADRLIAFIPAKDMRVRILSGFTDLLCESNIPDRWRLDDGDKPAVRRLLYMMIQLYRDLLSEITEERDVESLRSNIFLLENETEEIWRGEMEDGDALPEAVHQIKLVKLLSWHSKAYLPEHSYIKDLHEKYPVSGEITIPERPQLVEAGIRLFNTEGCRGDGLLLLVLAYFLKSVRKASAFMDEIKMNQASGGGTGNVPGIVPMTDSLVCLNAFVGREELIIGYLAPMISRDDECFCLAAGINREYSLVNAPEKISVVKSLCVKLAGMPGDEPGRLAIRKLCVKWGLIGKKHLPAGSIFKAPKMLPRNVADLVALYDILKLKDYFVLGRKGSYDKIPGEWPLEIRDIYLTFDGSKETGFIPVAQMNKLRKVIRRTLDNDMMDAEGDDMFEPDDGKIDIREHLHDGIIPVGKDASGDMFFVDPESCSLTGQIPVIRYHHDQMLTGSVEANSLPEFLGRLFIERFEHVNGPDSSLEKLKAVKAGLKKKKSGSITQKGTTKKAVRDKKTPK